MKTSNSIIKVIFLLRKGAPVSLKSMTYFVNTNNYVIADKKAKIKLKEDLEVLAIKYKESTENLLRYYDNVVMCEINLI